MREVFVHLAYFDIRWGVFALADCVSGTGKKCFLQVFLQVLWQGLRGNIMNSFVNVIYIYIFFFFLSSGGWGIIKLKLTTLPCISISVVCPLNSGSFATQRQLAHPSDSTVCSDSMS